MIEAGCYPRDSSAHVIRQSAFRSKLTPTRQMSRVFGTILAQLGWRAVGVNT
jgi:hypothetical protein